MCVCVFAWPGSGRLVLWVYACVGGTRPEVWTAVCIATHPELLQTGLCVKVFVKHSSHTFTHSQSGWGRLPRYQKEVPPLLHYPASPLFLLITQCFLLLFPLGVMMTVSHSCLFLFSFRQQHQMVVSIFFYVTQLGTNALVKHSICFFLSSDGLFEGFGGICSLMFFKHSLVCHLCCS